MSCRCCLARGWTDFGSLLSTLPVLCTQQALFARRPVDLAQSLPEAERPVAGGECGRDREAAALEIEPHFAPGLGALAVAPGDFGGNGQQLLPAILIGADDDQDALLVVIQPWREVDAVGPEVDKAPGREIAPLPMLHFPLPDLLEADNARGREPGRLRPKERRERLGKIARGQPFR